MTGTKIVTLLLCFCIGYGYAAETPQEDGGMREIRIAEAAFSRGGPIPVWVDPIAIPATSQTVPVVIRLADTQLNAVGTPQAFVRRALQVNQSGALANIGQIPIYFNPQFQKLSVHGLRILRGSETIDQTSSAVVRFLQRETGLDNGIYSGLIAAVVLFSDLRVGDTIVYEYTIEGQNPVFGDKYLEMAGWDQPSPVELRQVRLRHPAKRNIQWRMVGDFRPQRVAPRIEERDGIRELRFAERGIAAIQDEPNVPRDYFPVRNLQFSEFRDWNEVARWAEDLFHVPETLPPELSRLVIELRALPDDESRVVRALQWVQSEIRYLSLAIGESSHRPYPPEEVVQRRYGDCKDKTFLLKTILKALGIHATPVLVSVETGRGVAKLLPAPDVFDHVILRVSLNGRSYYLDGTLSGQVSPLAVMGSAGNDNLGIPASGEVRELLAIGRAPVPSDELEEKIMMTDFSGDGIIESERRWHGISADQLRAIMVQLTPEQKRLFAASSYERRYPGIVMQGEPEVRDDVDRNELAIKVRFHVPKLVTEVNNGWAVRFFPNNLQGVFNFPENLKRNFPLAVPAHPYKGRYQLQVEWPESVSGMLDPVARHVGGEYFDARIQQEFRGRRAQLAVDFNTRTEAVPAHKLVTFLEDTEALNKALGGSIYVSRELVKSGGVLGFGRKSLQESIRERLRTQIDRTTKVIEGGRVSGDDLAQTYCNRAGAWADSGHPEKGLRDAEEGVKIAPVSPDSWYCLGVLHFDNADFAASVGDFTKALSLGYDEAQIHYRRGHARYFLGKLAEAENDFRLALESRDESLRTYASLWLVAAMRQQGKEIPDTLHATAAKDQDVWPKPALALALGMLNPEQLQEELAKRKGDEREMNQAEALYYLGQYYLGQGKPELARDAFRQTREKGITVYLEHIAAGFELQRLGNVRPAEAAR